MSSWKSDRPSIPRLLLESLRFFLPRAPKLTACFLPYYVLGWVAFILSRLLRGDVTYPSLSGYLITMTSLFAWMYLQYLGLASVSWATARNLESHEPSFSEIVRRPFRHPRTLFLVTLLSLLPMALPFAFQSMDDFLLELEATYLGWSFSIFGVVLLLTGTTFIVIRLRLIRTVVIVEGTGLFGCILRSIALTKGSSFYVLFLFFIQQLVILGPLLCLVLGLFGMLSVSGPGVLSTPIAIAIFILIPLLHFITLALFSGVTDGVLYHHLRRLKETRA